MIVLAGSGADGGIAAEPAPVLVEVPVLAAALVDCFDGCGAALAAGATYGIKNPALVKEPLIINGFVNPLAAFPPNEVSIRLTMLDSCVSG